MPSFDVVSEVDMQEVANGVNNAMKEVKTRYDLKNSKSSIELNLDTKTITILADDKMKLKAVTEILNEKIAKRGVGLRALDYKDPEDASGSMLRQQVTIKHGISQEDGKKIVKLIKDSGLKKIQAQIQQDQVRITAPKRDDLQAAIKYIKDEVELELQFENFRD